MIGEFLRALLPSRAPPPVALRRREHHRERPALVYAIGDPHGRLDLYTRLEEKIAEDAGRAMADAVLVVLGNVVDRGPQTAELIERLVHPPPATLHRIVLAGNHEQAMLDFLRDPAPDHGWLAFGGMQTLMSYGVDHVPDNRRVLRRLLQEAIPAEHRAFLADLPSMVTFPGIVLVHAGVEGAPKPGVENGATRLWEKPAPRGQRRESRPLQVHGHTPVVSVDIAGDRINVDTGACFSGKLSAIRIAADGGLRILEIRG